MPNPAMAPAYPLEWIRHAQSENTSLSCFDLVYKRGCAEVRKGTIRFEMTIDDDGSVVKFTEVENRISRDKSVVSQCFQKNLPRWKFHAPEGHSKTFQLRVILSDKC